MSGAPARALRMTALPAALLALWEMSGRLAGGPRTPLPSRVAQEAVLLVASGDLPWGLAQSLGRVFAGFLIATAIAVPLGLLMGRSRAVERNLDPLVESFRPVAAIAMLPLAILWLGAGTRAAVMLVAYAAFFPILIHTIAGAKGVDRRLTQAAATMGVGRGTLLRTVVVPGALPQIGVGLRIGLGVAWTAIVAAELAVGAKAGGGGSGGVGQMMFAYYAYSIELNRIVVCMIAVGLVSLSLDRLVRFGLRRNMPWSES
jgi:ABC-type nitrate/sulfonate/bicarbonate transport system permease component